MITKEELETIRSKAPFLSEGSISPFQVSNMGKREKAEYNKNREIRFKAEAEFKRQNMTEQEKQEEKEFYINKEIGNLEAQIGSKKRTIEYLKELPAFKSKRMNNIKRGVLIEEEEIKKEELKIKELEGRLNKNE
jgi:hypothetical protein